MGQYFEGRRCRFYGEKQWAWKVENGMININDAPDRYLDAVKLEFDIM